MRARRVIGWAHTALLGAQILAGFLVVVVGGIQRANEKSIEEFRSHWVLGADIAGGAQTAAWWLLPLLIIVSGVLGLLRKLIGPPWLWHTVHSYLDTFRDEAFEVGPDDDLHHHRVTLFRHVGWCWRFAKWPWSGWLVPVERSGHTTQSSISVFKAPDDADNAEGVAGRTWARRRIMMVSNLPDLGAETSEDALKRYCEATGISVDWARKRRPRARSFCGMPVEVKGQLWGVIVLDSRSPNGIKAESQLSYRPLGKYLGKILERV
jgi:hypothetical protein